MTAGNVIGEEQVVTPMHCHTNKSNTEFNFTVLLLSFKLYHI